ncbi:MAG: DUF1501 domain-containing protein [Phycisphaeraceae bacterium]|nr:DUF1501 domain-containing protein [Phycisphaerae bacterium]MBX3393024.1 DUF1501 domain-containing protein [Phycisphaeraceae bacterium]
MEPIAIDPLIARTRRQFFQECGVKLGSLGLASLLTPAAAGTASALAPLTGSPHLVPHHAPKAKSIIYLFMNGAPSQFDLFEHKPMLARHDREPIPEQYTRGERFAFVRGTPRILASPYRFERHGRCGAEVSELLPHTASIVDDLCFVRTCKTDAFNHAPAELFINTGFARVGRPSMGSWLTYGLGSECKDLPGFVVLLSGGGQPSGGCSCWSSGFLPTSHQGVQFRPTGDAVPFTSNPRGVDQLTRRRSLDALADLNRAALDAVGDPQIASRIHAYEMAYRMQSSVPELLDLSGESPETLEMYGATPGQASFAANCVLARRLVERGVRFIQLYHRGWDSHGTSPDDDIVTSLPQRCRETDQACAALVMDLKRRGMLDSTIVIWGGEFGRTPVNEARNGSTFLGRDHHPHAFTMWFAGAGIKKGLTIGQTDDLGYFSTSDPLHVHDLHATLLHLLGIDHTRLTYRFQGREYRLTDVHGRVFSPMLA